jgi:hypothetical protein
MSDIVGVSKNESSIVIMFAHDRPTRGFSPLVITNRAGAVIAAAAVDVDRDGFKDVVFASDFGVGWYKNSGGGTPAFAPRSVPLSLPCVSSSLQVGDLNGGVLLPPVCFRLYLPFPLPRPRTCPSARVRPHPSPPLNRKRNQGSQCCTCCVADFR